ncbi:hypothetical protein V6N13_009881 [Hibiscus sabdariffa]|uniref:Prolamin-like domain-containing protein n=1 Tax=Hibiscus sabdariffa TaxID=183260 RepID=A0ABR2BC48_9ROSI
MGASLKFLAMLIFLTACVTQVSVVSANRNLIGLRGPDPDDSYIAPFLWTDVRVAISECRPFFISMDPDPEPSCCAVLEILLGDILQSPLRNLQICDLDFGPEDKFLQVSRMVFQPR